MLKPISLILFALAFALITLNACSSFKSAPKFASPETKKQLRWIANEENKDDGDGDKDEVVKESSKEPEAVNIVEENKLRGEAWEHDGGPDVTTAVGKKYAEIFAKTPNYRKLGETILGGHGDKFRWQFGPMFYRGRLGENQVKVLVIGQEGAQDENVSDRSFTGGTGGRMQHMLGQLGIDRSYLFINTFIYTIQGQYADFVPFIGERNGKKEIYWDNLLTPQMLLMAQDERSPIVQHRHELIDHVIEANKDSLELIIAVGGAAQDSLATYIKSKGGDCAPKVSNPEKIQLLKYASTSAGGNKKFYFPVDAEGKNALLNDGENPDFKNEKTGQATQEKFKLRAKDPVFSSRFIPVKTGPYKNGLVDMRQTTMSLSSCRTSGGDSTLKGIKGVDKDIKYIGVQHPGSNSPKLQERFAAALKQIHEWQEAGMDLDPDPGMKQPFEKDYHYSHKPVPRRDFRFGLPDIIGTGKTTTTRRDGGRGIEFGSRDSGSYVIDPDAYTPSEEYTMTDLPNEPNKTNFEAFDFGPGERWTKIFTDKLPFEELTSKNTTALPKFGASAIYRGRPDSTEVLILADQTSHDDLWAGRALMGLEGQKLQAFLQGIGAGLNYTIIRTLPVDTLGAKQEEIDELMKVSSEWRKNVLEELVNNSSNKQKLKLILTLGTQAEKAIVGIDTKVPVISLTAGYKNAFEQIKDIPAWDKKDMKLQTQAIPIAREDVPYAMRRWTGTSGNRVVRASGKWSGKLYKVVAPKWATSGKAAIAKPLNENEVNALKTLTFEK